MIRPFPLKRTKAVLRRTWSEGLKDKTGVASAIGEKVVDVQKLCKGELNNTEQHAIISPTATG